MPNARYVTLKSLFSIILEYDLCMATKKSIIERSRLLGLGATSPGGACLLKKEIVSRPQEMNGQDISP